MKSKTIKAFFIITAAIFTTGCAAGGSVFKRDKGLASDEYLSYIEVPADLSTVTYSAQNMGEVTEEMIQAELEGYKEYVRELEEVKDRDAVKKGDVVNIDYAGSVDGRAFDGGTDEGFDLEIGSGTFIDGFEKQLIGAKKGETVEVNCRFPDDYFEEDLAGKDALFKVTINTIQEYNDVDFNDSAVEKIGIVDMDGNPVTTLKGLEEYVRGYMGEQYSYYNSYNLREAAITGLLECTEIKEEFTDEMIDAAALEMASITGQDIEKMSEEDKESVKDSAREYLKEVLAVNAVAKNEKISVTDDEVKEYIRSMYAGEAATTAGENVGGTEAEYSDEDLRAYSYELLREKVADRVVEKGRNTYIGEESAQKNIEVQEEETEPKNAEN